MGVKTTERNSVNILEDNNNMDKDIVRKFMNDSKQRKTQTTLPTLNDIENLGQAIIRLSSRRRKEYIARVGEVIEKIKGKDLGVLLEKLSTGDSFDDLEKSGKSEQHDDKTFRKTRSIISTESESKNTTDSESSSNSESESSSSSNQSSSDSDSSSGTDSESDSDDDDESDDRQRQHGNVRPDFSGHLPPPPTYHGYAYPYSAAAAAFPQPLLPLPTHPPPPGHPAVHAWYSQWAASVAMNRQTVQQVEYGKYMQYLAYCQARK